MALNVIDDSKHENVNEQILSQSKDEAEYREVIA